MNSLTVEGKNYVKASVIARDLGYTADYVGQLCRAGKVKAELVGRTWYVDKDSIKSHKTTRYRSVHKKTVDALKDDIAIALKEAPANTFGAHFYDHSKKSNVQSYLQDTAALIPEVSKEREKVYLSVDLADAAKVAIASAPEKYNFQTPKVEPIKFKGTLVVSDFETPEVMHQKTAKIIHPKLSPVVKKTSNNIDSPALRAQEDDTVKLTKVREVSPLDHPHDVEVIEVQERKILGEVVTLSTSFVVAMIVVMAILGFEAHLFVTKESVTVTYVFEFARLAAAVVDAI